MNWRDFLLLASRLAVGAGEADWRTAVSRMQSLFEERPDSFGPVSLLPADPYFATWTTNGYADASHRHADRPL
jgi:hypothetical protein